MSALTAATLAGDGFIPAITTACVITWAFVPVARE